MSLDAVAGMWASAHYAAGIRDRFRATTRAARRRRASNRLQDEIASMRHGRDWYKSDDDPVDSARKSSDDGRTNRDSK